MTSTLEAIDRQLEALVDQPDPKTEATYWARYRRQVIRHHGKLEPPDFQRRRRVPLDRLYVSPDISPEDTAVISGRALNRQKSRSQYHNLNQRQVLQIDGFAALLDRTVLLGDPGGGKTTATHYIMDRYAQGDGLPTPFIVVLRDFTSGTIGMESVVSHIERQISALYQCSPPRPGMLERLFLNGSALVIFDGLDELLDSTLRGQVADIIELFCSQYPLCRVLVTSRRVGYEEARLDTSQFECWGIAGFDERRVAQYVHNWFDQEAGLSKKEKIDYAKNFLKESAAVSELIRNPLMLSLMCILYRGEGYIPRNRAEVYGQCARLLFVKWDTARGIHVELRSHELIEPAIRLLAYWLFDRAPSGTAVTERELVRKVTSFLHGRGFEMLDEAEAAAEEFVSFCRGRAWVFSDAGLTPDGDCLYTFTHRTFMEYFAAYHLATSTDTPEKLARLLAPHVAREEWEVVAELAVQIKNSISDRGADRIFEVLLRNKKYTSATSRANIICFLIRCLEVVSPSPNLARQVARRTLMGFLEVDAARRAYYNGLYRLSRIHVSDFGPILGELEKCVDENLKQCDAPALLRALLWLRTMYSANETATAAWIPWLDNVLKRNKQHIANNLYSEFDLAPLAIEQGIISVNDVIAYSGGDLTAFFVSYLDPYFSTGRVSLSGVLYRFLKEGSRVPAWAEDLCNYCNTNNDALERRVRCFEINEIHARSFVLEDRNERDGLNVAVPGRRRLGPSCYFIAVAVEMAIRRDKELLGDRTSSHLKKIGVHEAFLPFVLARLGKSKEVLPVLPVSKGWNAILRDWALGTLHFVAPLE
ncbi:NACHT domain-containing protein [Nonomuraea sp. NPDC048881]|uniref:NACHT domain-containing protein n=1 Tax=Nonomuraea sp. NPDC048881 TaxID=3155030 RepID=UPI0034048873